MNRTYVTVLLFSLIFLVGAAIEDRCSKHSHPNDEYFPYYLTECPSSGNFNLLECYDVDLKNDSALFTMAFYCWSRRDNDESVIKNVSISTNRVEDDDLIEKINKPFTTQFTSNGTHLKCDTMEKWATKSFPVDISTYDVPCVTSTISVAEFNYNYDYNGYNLSL